MKCKDCKHCRVSVSDNPFCKRVKKYYECSYPVRDTDGAILSLKSVRSISYKNVTMKIPDWCPKAAENATSMSDTITINLTAPAGSAAKRMSETTGMPAKTIHRLLNEIEE